MKRFSTVVLILAALGAAACGPSFTAATPPDFVEVENDHDAYDYRATTADGLVLGIREIEHDPKGQIDFWVRAIQNRMRDVGGYALLETRDIQNARGVKGKQLRFGHDEGKSPHLYTVSLFVTDDMIYVLEAGGTKELMERHADQLEWSVKHFHF